MTTLTPEDWARIRAAYEACETPVEDICVAYGISSTTLRNRMRRWGWTRRRPPPVPREGPGAVVIPGRGHVLPSRPSGDALSAASPESSTPALRRLYSGPAAVAASRNDEEMAVALPHPTPTVFAAAQTVDPPPPGEGESAWAAPAIPAADLGAQLQSAVARVLPAIEAIIARLAAGAGPREMEQAGRALSSLTRALRELNALLAQHGIRPADDDPVPENIDDFRNELARRIRVLIAQKEAERQAEQEASPDRGGDGAAPPGEAKPAET